MSVVSIAAAAGPEQQNANEIVADANRLAFERFSSDLMSSLKLSYGEKAIETIGNFRFGEDIEPSEVGSAGMTIKFLRTAYSKLRLSRIYFKSASAVTNKVISISDGVNVENHTFSAGIDEEVIIETQYSSFQGRIEISYDMSDVIPYTQSLHGHSSLACSSCTGSTAAKRIACYGFMPGVSSSATIYGLFVDASLECDGKKAACSLLPSVRMEFLYLVGSILFEKRLASNRLNWIAIASREYAEQKVAEYEGKYLAKMSGSERAFLSYLQRVDALCTACRTLQYSYSV